MFSNSDSVVNTSCIFLDSSETASSSDLLIINCEYTSSVASEVPLQVAHSALSGGRHAGHSFILFTSYAS